MDRVIARLTERRAALLVVLAVAAATIGAALFSQHVLGYIPCKLCLLAARALLRRDPARARR